MPPEAGRKTNEARDPSHQAHKSKIVK